MSTFELVGLPGSGKTTICTELLARADDARPSPVAHRLKGLRNSMLVRLFAPIAAVRFRRVLREIARGQGRSALASTLQGTAKILVTRPERLRRSADASVDVQFFLARFLMERALTRCDAWIRRTTLLYDEGYVQRALGLWLRAPAAVRDEAWRAFLACLPARIRCIHVELPAEIALERSLHRAGGVPRSVRRIVDDESDRDALLGVYSEMESLIHEAAHHSRVEMSRLPSDSAPRGSAGELIARLRRDASPRGIRVVVRRSRPRLVAPDV